MLPCHGFAQGHGPHIKIWANGELFLDQQLRDNEVVSEEQLGNYLGRVAFRSTAKVPIEADKEKADQAVVKGKFELQLSRREGKFRPILTVTFEELRLTRLKADKERWYLTREGVELIEKAVPKKK
jgi:hypothetical protein